MNQRVRSRMSDARPRSYLTQIVHSPNPVRCATLFRAREDGLAAARLCATSPAGARPTLVVDRIEPSAVNMGREYL